MDKQEQPKRKRWYDKDQTVSQSVKMMEEFPEEFRDILGETLLGLADKQCNAKELMRELRTLAPEKVLAIFKAKSRQRFYDASEQVHEAMNHLYIVPETDRLEIAKQAIVVTGHFNRYLEICSQEGRKPNPQVLSGLSNLFLRDELHNVEESVAKLEKELAEPRESVVIREGTVKQDMKIRLDKAEP